MAAGCTSGHPAATRSAPLSTPPARSAPPTAEQRVQAAHFLALATAGNTRLERDFDRLDGPDRGRLAAARADLRDAATTEHLFDQHLTALGFAPQTEATAKRLAAVNEARADLTATAADVTSLQLLHQYEIQLTAANAPVEEAVSTIRSQLGLPPPATS